MGRVLPRHRKAKLNRQARGENPTAFERPCITSNIVALRSNMHRYAPSSRLVGRAPDRSRCERDFHHGLLERQLFLLAPQDGKTATKWLGDTTEAPLGGVRSRSRSPVTRWALGSLASSAQRWLSPASGASPAAGGSLHTAVATSSVRNRSSSSEVRPCRSTSAGRRSTAEYSLNNAGDIRYRILPLIMKSRILAGGALEFPSIRPETTTFVSMTHNRR